MEQSGSVAYRQTLALLDVMRDHQSKVRRMTVYGKSPTCFVSASYLL